MAQRSKAASRRKLSSGKSIVYPLFLEMSNIEKDSHWKDLFIQYSQGDLPRTYALSGQILTHKKMGNIKHYEISSDPVDAIRQIKQLFKTNDTKSSSKSTPSTSSTLWKSIKKKQVKSALLDGYIETLSNQLFLSPKQIQSLTYAINMSRVYDLLNDNTVIIRNGIIHIISCIKQKDGLFIVDTTNAKKINVKIAQPPDPSFKEYPRPQINLYTIFSEYIDSIEKRLEHNKLTTIAEVVQDIDEE